ncbi:MAG: hypothetical protein PVG53_05375 [Holophagae bacterium]
MRSARESFVAGALAAATLAQGAAVVLLGRLGGRLGLQVMVVAAALAGLVYQAWRHRLRLNHRVDMLLVMGAFGGLGMLAGWWIDLGWTAPPRDASFHVAMGHGCGGHMVAVDHGAAAPGDGCCPGTADPTRSGSEGHEPPASSSGPSHGGGMFWPMVFSWMTGLMLVGAIPPGAAFTRCARLARTSRRRWISTHVVGNALMIAGMIWLGHRIGPVLATATGSAVLGGHLGMLAGMLLGMEVGMFGGEALLGLRPWREWTWRGDSTPPAEVT